MAVYSNVPPPTRTYKTIEIVRVSWLFLFKHAVRTIKYCSILRYVASTVLVVVVAAVDVCFVPFVRLNDYAGWLGRLTGRIRVKQREDG